MSKLGLGHGKQRRHGGDQSWILIRVIPLFVFSVSSALSVSHHFPSNSAFSGSFF